MPEGMSTGVAVMQVVDTRLFRGNVRCLSQAKSKPCLFPDIGTNIAYQTESQVPALHGIISTPLFARLKAPQPEIS